MKKRGISLILLVITIIIIIIIASAVILNLNNNNPVDKARVASVQQARDSLKSGINLYIAKIMVKENGEHYASTMILGKNAEVENYSIIAGSYIAGTTNSVVILGDKRVWQLDYTKVESEVGIKLDTYDGHSRWYIDEYGNPYLVYDKLSNVSSYLKDETGNVAASVRDFVIYLDQDIEFAENTQPAVAPEPEEDLTVNSNTTINSNSKITLSGFSRNGIKSITYIGPRQGTITPTVNGKNYTAEANVGNGTYAFTVTDNNDEVVVKQITVEGVTSFTIATVEDLCRFRDYVNMGDNFEGVTVTQTANLDLSTVCSVSVGSWTPIGIYSDNVFFSGEYNGSNYKIDNLYINEPNKKYMGLFGVLNNGKIYNTNISGSIIAQNCAGGICSYVAENGEFYNCSSNVSVSVSEYNVGGILAKTMDSSNVKIEECINFGSMSAVTSAGGIIGRIDYRSKAIVNKCCNFGSINGMYSGGCAGNVSDESEIEISNCYNRGTISGENGAYGGILGGFQIIRHDGKLTAKIENCYNSSVINASSNVGAIIGNIVNISEYTLINNYWETGKGASYGIGTVNLNTGASGVNATTLKGYASTLGSAYKADTNNINGGYPVLSWE